MLQFGAEVAHKGASKDMIWEVDIRVHAIAATFLMLHQAKVRGSETAKLRQAANAGLMYVYQLSSCPDRLLYIQWPMADGESQVDDLLQKQVVPIPLIVIGFIRDYENLDK